jgi:hypothetical protein
LKATMSMDSLDDCFILKIVDLEIESKDYLPLLLDI